MARARGYGYAQSNGTSNVRTVGLFAETSPTRTKNDHGRRVKPSGADRAPQYNVLSAIETEPGICNAELARAAFVTAQSMQGIVANLAKVRFDPAEPASDSRSHTA